MKIHIKQIFTLLKHRELMAITAITVLTTALYLPFLSNAIVFDDNNLYTNLSIFDYAIRPFSLAPRAFPYFTLGFTEVIWKSIEVHRIISLVLHVLNSILLFRIVERFTIQIGKVTNENALIIAFVASLSFSIHPVAVYGAGYLIQRTMLFSTFFALLSIWFYWRSLIKNRINDSISAAAFYSLAIFSKEHAIMLPAAALALTVLHDAPLPTNLKKALIYLGLSTPLAIFIVLVQKGIIGTAYEPDAVTIIGSIPGIEQVQSQWLLSITNQSGLFFRYLQNWILPDIRSMSADIRVDLFAQRSNAWAILKLFVFFSTFLAALKLLVQKGKLGIIGWGVLYAWLMFATELVSIRFQEPFVLYRSYIWAPGFTTAIAGILALANLSKKYIFLIFGIVTVILFTSSRNRLESMKDEYSLWSDAAEKLEYRKIPGSERIYYNRGLQRIKQGILDGALDDMNLVIEKIPNSHIGYLGRSYVHQQSRRYENAYQDLLTAKDMNPPVLVLANIEYEISAILKKLNQPDEAVKHLEEAARLGNTTAQALIQIK